MTPAERADLRRLAEKAAAFKVPAHITPADMIALLDALDDTEAALHETEYSLHDARDEIEGLQADLEAALRAAPPVKS